MRVLRTEDRRDASRVGVLLDIIDLNDLLCRIDEGLTARSCVAEPDRGRRNWSMGAAQAPVYGNRRWIREARGRRLTRRDDRALVRPS